MQVEKVSFAVATSLLGDLGTIVAAGPSLGSFSVSHAMLVALVAEFAPELLAKSGSLDTDPHLWMPLTLGVEAYVGVMGKKGMCDAAARAHHARMRGMRARMTAAADDGGAAAGSGALAGGGGLGLFGAVDVGADAFWWDYGQVRRFLSLSLSLLT